MSIALEFIYDPELVVPSASAKDDVEFWTRLLSWSSDDRPKLGERSLEGLVDLLATPPQTTTITPQELHEILGRLAGRILPPQGSGQIGHADCITGWLPYYSPKYGDQANPDRLASCLAQVPFGTPAIIASDPDCWPDVLPSACSLCQAPRLYVYSLDDRGAESALRAEFLSDSARTLVDLRDFAQVLFPAVRFAPSAWDRVSTLQGDTHTLTSKLVKHLGVLNDHAAEVWASTPQTDERIQALGSYGVDASPESRKTRASKRYMSLRDFVIDGTSRRCEWHTKLDPYRNRVHFAVIDGIPYVGTIEKHLATA